jgi:hypothetical protein
MSRIEGWKIRNTLDGNYDIIGSIYDDDRTEDGNLIITSNIRWINFEDKVAKTKNTLYRLGKPAKEETNED